MTLPVVFHPARGLRFALSMDRFSSPRFEAYTHQVEAIEAVRAGRSVVIATGTASGKSLCYQIPISEASGSGATESAHRQCR